MMWKQETFTVNNQGGIHSRVAVRLAEIANTHQVDLIIQRPGESIACDAILDILSLALVCGSQVTLVARGKRAAQALDAAGMVLAGDNDY